jgi:integral membrane protein (TIGR01906 family)
MPKRLKISQVAVALTLPLVLLLGNIQTLMHPRFVHYEYAQNDFPDDMAVPPGGYPMSKAERTTLAETAVASIIGPAGMRVLEEAHFQETGALAFNGREMRHMRDVRLLYQRVRVVFWIALALLAFGLGFLIWQVRQGKKRALLTRPLLFSSAGTLSLMGILGLYILSSFNSFFTRFHHVFFQGNTWLFRRDDTLIRLFPTEFWFDAALFIAGATVIELVGVGLWAWWWEKRQYHPLS